MCTIDTDIGKIFQRPNSSYTEEWVAKMYTRDGAVHYHSVNNENALLVKCIFDTVFYMLYYSALLRSDNGDVPRKRKRSLYNQHISKSLLRIAAETPNMPRNLRMQIAVKEWKEYAATEETTKSRLKDALNKME